MIYSAYSRVTGLFTGMVVSVSDPYLLWDLGGAEAWHEGSHDPLALQIDTETGELVARSAPPDGDDMTEWGWSDEKQRWEGRPTAKSLACSHRAERARRMAAFQWRLDRHARELRLGVVPTDDIAVLDTYMQAMADLTEQPGFPHSFTWPEEPK